MNSARPLSRRTGEGTGSFGEWRGGPVLRLRRAPAGPRSPALPISIHGAGAQPLGAAAAGAGLRWAAVPSAAFPTGPLPALLPVPHPEFPALPVPLPAVPAPHAAAEAEVAWPPRSPGSRGRSRPAARAPRTPEIPPALPLPPRAPLPFRGNGKRRRKRAGREPARLPRQQRGGGGKGGGSLGALRAGGARAEPRSGKDGAGTPIPPGKAQREPVGSQSGSTGGLFPSPQCCGVSVSAALSPCRSSCGVRRPPRLPAPVNSAIPESSLNPEETPE